MLGLLCAQFSHAAEKKLSASDLPPAVQKTVEDQTKGATIKGYSKDRENGRVEYEVEMVVDGHSKDVSIASDGSVLEVEEDVPMDALAANVQSGLKNKAGKSTSTKVESITKQGKLEAYEAQIQDGSKHSEIQVGPSGETLRHEE